MPTIHFLNVKSGDCSIIEHYSGHKTVIDICNAQLGGLESVRDYLRQCIYDSVAEWQARAKTARIDSDTIKLLKDRLLRVPLEMESHAAGEEAPDEPAS